MPINHQESISIQTPENNFLNTHGSSYGWSFRNPAITSWYGKYAKVSIPSQVVNAGFLNHQPSSFWNQISFASSLPRLRPRHLYHRAACGNCSGEMLLGTAAFPNEAGSSFQTFTHPSGSRYLQNFGEAAQLITLWLNNKSQKLNIKFGYLYLLNFLSWGIFPIARLFYIPEM